MLARSKHRVHSLKYGILKIEKYLLLLPVTIISVPGLAWMLLTPLGDLPFIIDRGFTQKLAQFLTLEILTLLSAGALISMWLAIEKYLKNEVALKFSENPYIYVLIIAGVIISLLSLVEFLYPNHYLKQLLGVKENTAFFLMYIFGLPICIPAVHILLLGKQDRANNTLQAMPKSGTPEL